MSKLSDGRDCLWGNLGLTLMGRVKVKMKSLSRVRLFATPWTAAHQAPLPMGFYSKSTRVGCHFRVMLSKSLTQFFVNGRGYIRSLSFGLRLNYDRGNDRNGNLLQKDLHQHSVATCCIDCCIQGPNPVAGLLECLKNYGQKFTTLYKRQ